LVKLLGMLGSVHDGERAAARAESPRVDPLSRSHLVGHPTDRSAGIAAEARLA